MDEFIAVAKHVFLKNYINFKGRAGRKEFWYAFLFSVVVSMILGFIPGWVWRIIALLWSLAILLPTLGVGARRLHDTNKSELLLLLLLLPLVGQIIMIVLWAMPGDPAENQYGPVPADIKPE